MYRKNRLFTTILTCFFLLCLVAIGTGSAAIAKTPASDLLQVSQARTLPYSGVLTNPDGKAVADGRYDFTFSLYDAPKNGNLLWTENQSGVVVTSGDFKTTLGQLVDLPASIFDIKEIWMEVSLRGPSESAFTMLSPRQMISPDAPAETNALTCPHSHFTDYWYGTNTAYGLEVDNGTGTGDGIRGYSGATLYNYAGVYAINNGGTGGGDGGSGVYAASSNGYGGYMVSNTYRGLYASGAPAWYAAYIENPAGASNTGLYVNGTMWVTGAKTGFVVDIAVNDGNDPLETGDLVIITGYGDPVVGLNPLIKVRKADQAGSTAVMGVVDQPYNSPKIQSDPNREPLGPIAATASKSNGTAIAPGGYLSVVTLGSYRAVKVDASFGPIHIGDLLVASSNPGYAMTSDDPKLGSVIGKALADWTDGIGLIPVFVTLK